MLHEYGFAVNNPSNKEVCECGLPASALLTFWIKFFFAVGAVPCIVGCLATSLASVHWLPVALWQLWKLKKHLETLGNIQWRARPPPVENHCYRVQSACLLHLHQSHSPPQRWSLVSVDNYHSRPFLCSYIHMHVHSNVIFPKCRFDYITPLIQFPPNSLQEKMRNS